MIYNIFSDALNGNLRGFLGRREVVKDITDRLLTKKSHDIHIHGLPRVGKTMLLKKLEEELNKETNCCAVRLELSPLDDFSMLLRKLIMNTKRRLTKSFSREILDQFNEKMPKTSDEFMELLYRFLAWTTKQGIHVIWLLDEFERTVGDSLTDKKDPSLQRWTEQEHVAFSKMLIENSFNFSCVAASRPEMEDILSVYRVKVDPFERFLLRGFNEEDMAEFFEVLKGYGYALDFEKQQELVRYCGRNPRLLTMLGNKIVSEQSATNIKQLYDDEKLEFAIRFQETAGHMKNREEREKRNFSHIVKCYFGYSSDNWDIMERCVEIGYIDLLDAESPYTYQKGNYYYVDRRGKFGPVNQRYVYITISHLFVEYLYVNELENVSDVRDLLTGFVHAFRDVTKEELTKQLGEDWNEKLMLSMEGKNSRFIMKSNVYNRYIMWWQPKHKKFWSCSEKNPLPKAVEEREEYLNQMQEGQKIGYISKSSFKFMMDKMNDGITNEDMPVLDVINLTENGEILRHYEDIFSPYFGCFGADFSIKEEIYEENEEHEENKENEEREVKKNPFIQCLEELKDYRNKICHFSRTGLSEKDAERTRYLCKKLINSMYTYISTGKQAEEEMIELH